MENRGISAPWVQSKIGDHCLVLSSYGYHLHNADIVARSHGIHQGHSTSQADDKIKTDLFPVALTTTVAGKISDALLLCLPHNLGYFGPETCILRQRKRDRGTRLLCVQHKYIIVPV